MIEPSNVMSQIDLFSGTVSPAGPAPVTLSKPRAPGKGGWELVDHACRHCMGRVLVRTHKGIPLEARCAECGARADAGHAEICCCGAECGRAGFVLECFRNPEITPAVPQEVLVREKLVIERRGNRRRSNPVGHSDL